MNDKLKKRIVAMIFATIFILPVFSQQQLHEKHVFVYKIVKGHEIKANIFLPNTNQKHPVVVYFHGGGFVFGNRDEGLEDVLRDKLLAHNYAVVSADYRLAPETKLDEILKDVSDVVIWLREKNEQFQIDINKIAIVGGSAAGYLALSTGYNVKPSPQAIVAISTPTDFSKANTQKGDESILKQPGPYDIVKDTVVSYGDVSSRLELWRFLAINRLLFSEVFGFDVSKDTTRLSSYMLTKHINSDYPPTLLIHARNDRLASLSQVEQFNIFLKGKNIKSELFIVDDGHNVDLINNNPDAVEKIALFLDKYLK